ncbi:MAG: VOC family protein [Rhodobacteraceae bacterium]|jgi:catechol 2,3-dioxygenase-like lactoylglutathione lyase family enzyme|nr:VOC family protein [Paracoccaceae bacterium]
MAHPGDSDVTPRPLAGILEAALYAADLDAAETFYGGLLGLERIARAGNRHVFFRVGDTILLVFNPAETEQPGTNPDLPVPPHGARGPGHLCFSATADALDDIARHLAASGVAIEADFRWPNGARSVYVRDPAGNSVEFAEPRLWAPPADPAP